MHGKLAREAVPRAARMLFPSHCCIIGSALVAPPPYACRARHVCCIILGYAYPVVHVPITSTAVAYLMFISVWRCIAAVAFHSRPMRLPAGSGRRGADLSGQGQLRQEKKEGPPDARVDGGGCGGLRMVLVWRHACEAAMALSRKQVAVPALRQLLALGQWSSSLLLCSTCCFASEGDRTETGTDP